MARRTGRLVIERVYDPPPSDEMAGILHRVYERLLADALLTQPHTANTMKQDSDRGGADDESGALRKS